jgi:hypothetical protein
MAASAWQLYNSAKKYIGNGVITLGAGTFKMALARSASNTSAFTLDAFGSLSVKFLQRAVTRLGVNLLDL